MKHRLISSGEVQLHLVNKADKKEWLRMRELLWPNCTAKKHISEMKQYVSGGRFAAFVTAISNGRLVGFVEVSLRPTASGLNTTPVGYLEGLYVDTDYRHKEVGRRLVRAAEKWAASKGCREMASDCVIGNKKSPKFHLSLGYKETDRLIHFKKSLNS